LPATVGGRQIHYLNYVGAFLCWKAETDIIECVSNISYSAKMVNVTNSLSSKVDPSTSHRQVATAQNQQSWERHKPLKVATAQNQQSWERHKPLKAATA
jgi:predicted fused transcriptional regulator/phosphomethylpyrimidine kinase